MKRIFDAFLNLIYPPICLHCNSKLSDPSTLLCAQCLSLLELVDPQERCPLCFSVNYCTKKRRCDECYKRHPILNGLAASFDYLGPAATLVKKLKYSNQTYLAEGCGAYLAAQFLSLEWPMPDLIVPVPIAFTHLFERGFNQSLLLAENLAKILQCPVVQPLKRTSGDYSQAGLNKMQRLKLEGSTIYLKKKQVLQDKRILLIDDVTTTGSTLRKCAEALLEGYPTSVHALCVCKALE